MSHNHEPKLQHPDHHGPHWRTFAGVFVLLLLGMILTIAVYFFMPTLGHAPWVSFANNLIAMTIACIKATLVIAIFMGVKYSSNLVKMYAIMGFVWVTLMTIAFCDYSTRHMEPSAGWTGDKAEHWVGTTEPKHNLPPYDPPRNVN